MSDVNVKILKGRLILELNQGFIEVKPFTKTHLVKRMGYYFKDKAITGEDPYVYIYRGKFKKTDYPVPGSIYKYGAGFKVIPHNEDKLEIFHLGRCKELSAHLVAQQLDDPNTRLREISPSIIDSADGDIFAPQIRDNDDILKRVIKTALQHMKLNIKTLKGKFANDYDLNNLKSQLIKEGAMSSKYFARWAEILDIDIEVIVRNKPGSNRLSDEVTIIMK